MLPLRLLTSLYLARTIFAQGTSTDTPSATCPTQSRSVLDILAACALTLLICVWQAIHPSVPSQGMWSRAWWKLSKIFLALGTFLLPEWMVYTACKEWYAARCIFATSRGIDFAGKDCKWSMTHIFFAEMGGFVYCDENGPPRKIRSEEFLRLCAEKKIVNPRITEQEIDALSKADTMGKVILALQLIWFTLQVSARYFNHLAVTLVELDTVCMAVLTIFLLVFWNGKPLRPECPRVFYSPEYVQRTLRKSDADVEKQELKQKQDLPSPVHIIVEPAPDKSFCKRLNDSIKVDNVGLVALCATWIVFGGLHLAAWNHMFLTNFEMISWRLASFILTVAPAAIFLAKIFTSVLKCCCLDTVNNIVERTVLTFALLVALVARQILVLLMFASLRSLPCTAYDSVLWTTYIPHLYVGISTLPAAFGHVV